MSDCRPSDCCDVPEPMEPRCDVVLNDGTFPNATVVVEDGCITAVSAGMAPLYTPELCSANVGGGNGSGGTGGPGTPGQPGQNATITVGQTFSVASGEPAQVVNTGTSTAAILDFYIPRGASGGGGGDGGCEGIYYDKSGFVVEGGCIVQLPMLWPPVMEFGMVEVPSGVTLTFTKNPDNGVVSVNLNMEQLLADIADDIAECCNGGGGDPGGGTPSANPYSKVVPAYLCPYDKQTNYGYFEVRYFPDTGQALGVGGNFTGARLGMGFDTLRGLGPMAFEDFQLIDEIYIDLTCPGGAP